MLIINNKELGYLASSYFFQPSVFFLSKCCPKVKQLRMIQFLSTEILKRIIYCFDNVNYLLIKYFTKSLIVEAYSCCSKETCFFLLWTALLRASFKLKV